jgi:Tol biopolymer transport system component/tRNA A-37 threonylcarbamoyl transferase component Bud32
MIGQDIGRFEILEQLGQGGLGVVWKARDRALDRIVALKLLRARTGSDHAERSQLAREARLASLLNHPNIVTIYEVGEHEGALYVAMEYVEGKTLYQLIPGQGLPIEDVFRIAAQIADGLAAAHAAGLVHRDLKPSNVMVTTAGRVKIVDFGLAMSVTPSAEAEARAIDSLTELAPGTLAYASPEQLAGRKADERSDLFSVGALMYEMASGRQAFRGKSPAATITAVLQERPLPLEGVSGPAARLIERLLRKEPERRWQTAVDLKAAIEDLRIEMAADTRIPPREAASRRRWLGAGALIAALAAGVAAWRLNRPARPPLEPVLTQLAATAGLQRDPTFSADGNQIAYSWNGADGQNFDIYVQAVGGGERLRLTSHPLVDEAPRWSPKGDRIAFVRVQDSNRKAIHTVGPLGGAERKVFDMPFLPAVDQTSYFCWTPDGNTLIASIRTTMDARGRLVAINALSGEMSPLGADGEYLGSEPAISPDGRWIGFIREGERYRVRIAPFDAARLKAGEARIAVQDDRSFDNPVWTADSQELIVTDDRAGGESRLFRIRRTDGALRPVEFAGVPSLQAAISPRGDRLAFTRAYTDTNIWKLPISGTRITGREEPLIVSSFLEMQPVWSPDGKRIAFETTRSGLNKVMVADAQGAILFQLGQGRAQTGSPAWSPDGRWIAFDTFHPYRSVHIAPADGGVDREVSRADVYSPWWSRDSKSLLVNRGSPPQPEFFRLPVDGGELEKLGGPGRYPRETADQMSIVYELQTSRTTSDIWRIPAAGGEAKLIVRNIVPRTWDLDGEDIWFVRAQTPAQAEIFVTRLDGQRETLVHTLRRPVMRGLSVSQKAGAVLYEQMDGRGSNVMVMENFR